MNIEEVITDIIGTTEAPPPQVARRKKSDIMPDEGEDEEFGKVSGKKYFLLLGEVTPILAI